MQAGNSWMRKKFREADAKNSVQSAVEFLSRLRESRPVIEFGAILRSFHISAPKAYGALFALGPRSASQLVWARGALSPVALERELYWAAHWLVGHSGRINSFRRISVELQGRVLSNDLLGAKEILDEYVRTAGWSLWAVELRAALLQLAEGTGAQRAWLDELQSKVPNSIPGLLFQVFGDRNDDTFSFDAIYGKCMSSFPRFESLAPWLVDYLKYRALSHVDDPAKALPGILSRDITSSLIDYYESLVEALVCIESGTDFISLRQVAARLVSALIDDGYQDYRLRKLSIALSDFCSTGIEIRRESDYEYRAVYLGASEPERSRLPVNVINRLIQCQEEGAVCYSLVGELLKWGLNFRSLDIGPAVATSALAAISSIPQERVLPFSVIMLSDKFCLDDVAAYGDSEALEFLNSYLGQKGLIIRRDQLLKPSTWSFQGVIPDAGAIHLWMAVRLLAAEDFDELALVTDFLHEKGPYWRRQSVKLRAQAYSKQGRIEEVVKLLGGWFQQDSSYALEFPSDVLFENRKWADFKELDPVEVGIVAHYEFEARGAANVGYICKMACRRFLRTGMRDGVVYGYEKSMPQRQAQLVTFLRDVWVEQNLSMCHKFESTADVRKERMSILQLLLGWEVERAQEYAEAIKDLTFDQTLQIGLERIDQTRVFVNESAITRWAEKELEQDYERWRRLSESSSGGRVVDDMLRQYALDPTNVEVLKEFANGKPTAADTLLIDIIDRVLKRFLLDPTDGLDTYLSVRIRHGSLRGTVLGPLEEQGLLYSTTGFSQEAFEARWSSVLNRPAVEKDKVLAMMQEFSKDILFLVDQFVGQRVQVKSMEKPDGAFAQVISPLSAKIMAASFAERPVSFHALMCSAYFVFWKHIDVGLSDLANYVNCVLAKSLHERIERLMQDLRSMGQNYLPLITTLTTAATMTKSQCDTVASWFKLPSVVAGERYQLPDAIEIASAATKNIHRAFGADVQVRLPKSTLPLTTSALAVLMDCLFVVFENAWKHSGLAQDLPPIELVAEFESESKLLTLVAYSALSSPRKCELLGGELSRLRTKYLGELPLELISLEGGSGFPKLARLTYSVPRTCCPQPFDFGIDNDRWYTRITVPLYEREGAFEAYE